MERTNLDERYHGEMLDRSNLSFNFDFSFEELFPDCCDSLPAINCQRPYLTPEDVIDESADVEAIVDRKLIKGYRKQMKKMKKQRKLAMKNSEEKRSFTSVKEMPRYNESVSTDFFEEELILAPAYPYKEGMRARYRN